MPGRTNTVSNGEPIKRIGCGALTTLKPNQTIVVSDVISNVRAGLQSLANNYGVRFYTLYSTSSGDIIWIEVEYDNIPIYFRTTGATVELVLGTDESEQIILALAESGIPCFKMEYITEFEQVTINLISSSPTSSNALDLIICGGKSFLLSKENVNIPSVPCISLCYSD